MGEQNNNELNLFDLIVMACKGIGRFFRWCGVSLLHLVRFSVQYIWIVGAFVIVFGVAGFFLTKPQFTTFRGGATILFVEEAAPMIAEYMQRLDLYARVPYMATTLGMPDSLQKKISSIECYRWIDCKHDNTPDFVDFDNDKRYRSDTTDVVMNDRLYLRVEARGLYDMACVQQWLQTYFDAQPELTALSEQGRQVLRMNMQTYDREIQRLDSLANHDYFHNESQQTEVKNGLLLMKGKQLYYNDILNLITQRGWVETTLNQRPNNINFQNDIVVTSALSRMVRFALWLLGGYLLGVLVALCVAYRREIAAYMKPKR
ncbi:MAG: hypothetical protein ACI392_01600 [Paludibacteraceae bacterium]